MEEKAISSHPQCFLHPARTNTPLPFRQTHVYKGQADSYNGFGEWSTSDAWTPRWLCWTKNVLCSSRNPDFLIKTCLTSFCLNNISRSKLNKLAKPTVCLRQRQSHRSALKGSRKWSGVACQKVRLSPQLITCLPGQQGLQEMYLWKPVPGFGTLVPKVSEPNRFLGHSEVPWFHTWFFQIFLQDLHN